MSGPSWNHLGTSLSHLGRFCCFVRAILELAHLGPTCPILGLSEDPFGPAWGYLGLLGAILDHLGGILGPRAWPRAARSSPYSWVTHAGSIVSYFGRAPFSWPSAARSSPRALVTHAGSILSYFCHTRTGRALFSWPRAARSSPYSGFLLISSHVQAFSHKPRLRLY